MARLLRRGTGLERFARRREPQGSRGFSDFLLIACTAPRQRRRSRPHSYVYGAGSAGGLAVPRRCEGRARSLILLEGLAYDGPLLWHSRRREVALCTRVSHRRSQVELPVRWRFRPRGFGSASGRWRRCGNLSVDWVQRRENFQTNWCLSLPLRTCSCLYCPFPFYSYRPSLASRSPSFSPSPSVVSHLAVFVFKK